MAITRVLLPNWAGLDSIVSYALLLERVAGRSLKIEFMSKGALLCTTVAGGDKSVFPIGVGKGRTYAERVIDGRKFNSETEMLIYEFRKQNIVDRDDAVFNDIATLMNRDTDPVQGGEGGCMSVRQPYALGWIGFQAYRLGYSHEEVVRRIAHAVSALIGAMRAKKEEGFDTGLHMRAKQSQASRLLPKGHREYYGPFTASRYIRDMMILGYGDADITERVSWFVEVHKKAKACQQAAAEAVAEGGFESFPLRGESGTWTENDSPYLMGELARQKNLVVMRSKKGNIIIMSKAFCMDGVAAILQAQESGLWYYEIRRQGDMLANGTESEPVPPTRFSKESLQRCIAAGVKKRIS